MPVIGGTSTLAGGAPNSSGLTVRIGTDGSSDYPVALHGNLAVSASGNGSATVTLDDVNAVSGTADSIAFGSGTHDNTVNIYGDKATATLGSLTVTSAGSGSNVFNLQTLQGTLYVSGAAMFNFSAGTDAVNVGSTSNQGIVETVGNFGVGGTGGTITTMAQYSTFGGLNFALSGSSVPTTTFMDDTVVGPAAIAQTGNTNFTINTSSSNTNATNSWDSLSITDGTGSDVTTINDTDFAGSVSINTGHGAGGTAQYAGSHTVLSALHNKGLLTIGGGLSISTTSGQSDSEVYDYNVAGSVAVTTGAGIRNQAVANFVGIENNQTSKSSGIPVIGGSLTVNGTTVGPASAGPNLVVDLGTDGSSGNYPLDIEGNLTVSAAGSGAATIDANDLNVDTGTTKISLGSGTSGNLVEMQGSSVTAVYNNLTILSLAGGTNTFDLQDSKGTMQVTGITSISLGGGNDTLNLAADSGNTSGLSGATLDFFGSSAPAFNGGGGVNTLWASAGNTVFFLVTPNIRNFIIG